MFLLKGCMLKAFPSIVLLFFQCDRLFPVITLLKLIHHLWKKNTYCLYFHPCPRKFHTNVYSPGGVARLKELYNYQSFKIRVKLIFQILILCFFLRKKNAKYFLYLPDVSHSVSTQGLKH